ncbi:MULTISPECIES: aminotransferase class V-fold PLP-dependent enzyme [unclassified Modestobacter]|uniref:aminotransferase class V-fold PLP-dependent enzyme n=1 Tax=unclassified Modestobacter TaxID=2643866 RepID=UPI0022AAB300|nr:MULTISPECIES: aminotransferase class V-fold PLP-dependent enzyme [unclassified Modestobacter]MCZ2826916.1 aminotransferase class V-fold PLP-dependent enzyme [Modestobacter sp. VKM Ac-2981]MCZ2855388.1 aminotransferase class V-fold PLP-dependent enzyme [Modestobacter sp. VKM Ac-2982]
MDPLVGADLRISVGGEQRRYVDLDAAATTSASAGVVRAVQEFLPWYSSVHRGAGAKSQFTSARYEQARETLLRFVGADPATHVALFPRNTTEALNLTAFRLGLTRDDVVVTTAVEHHANLLPWQRHAQVRVVDVDGAGTFDVAAVVAALDERPTPRVLAVSGASNVTGWMPDLAAIAAAARDRGVLVVVDGAQLVPHRPVDMAALGIDVLAWSGHKMFAPFGAGGLVVDRRLLADGEPFLVGGGAVKAVSHEEVIWADTPDRDDAGTPNVVGVVALAAAAEELLAAAGRNRVHEDLLVRALDDELATVPGLHRLGPVSGDRLPVAAFVIDGMSHGEVAERLAREHGIGVRSGCFCAHPYLSRLFGLTPGEVQQFHDDARADRTDRLPGAVRVSCSSATPLADVATLGEALRALTAHAGDQVLTRRLVRG